MIFAFSGTGNSSYVARRIAEVAGHQVRSINDALAGRGLAAMPAPPMEPLVFVAPTYAWQLPHVVRDWIERSDFGGKAKTSSRRGEERGPSLASRGHGPVRAQDAGSWRDAYFVLTCGGEIGNAPASIARLCRRAGLAYRGCAQIVMPDNYIVMFDPPTEEESRRIVADAEPAILEVAERIRRGDDLIPPRPGLGDIVKSGPVNALFNAVYIKSVTPSATDACTGCGACVRLCPLGNIRLEAGRPAWGKACTHCMACVSGCPQGAVECGKGTRGKRRYRCPVG